MTEVENLILEHLRHMRSGMDTIHEDLREAKTRLGNVENQCAALASQCAVLTNQYATVSTRLDRLDGRLERIERRLDLVEAPAS